MSLIARRADTELRKIYRNPNDSHKLLLHVVRYLTEIKYGRFEGSWVDPEEAFKRYKEEHEVHCPLVRVMKKFKIFTCVFKFTPGSSVKQPGNVGWWNGTVTFREHDGVTVKWFNKTKKHPFVSVIPAEDMRTVGISESSNMKKQPGS